MVLDKAVLRASARLFEYGVRTIDEIDEEYRVAVYLEMIAKKKFTINDVDPRYKDAVQQELSK